MSERNTPAATFHPEPTLLETELDSIAWTLSQMKAKLSRDALLEHLSDSERAELSAALHRAQARMFELDQLIGGEVRS